METSTIEPKRRAVLGRDWDKVREEYLLSEDSLKIVGERNGIPYPTIRDRSIGEGWAVAKESAAREKRRRLSETTRNVTETVLQNAVARAATTSALQATALINRTLKESDSWLDRIDAVAQGAAAHNPDAIRKLTGSWSEVIRVARLTHGLDATGTQINVAVFGRPIPVESESITIDVIPTPQE